MKGNPSVEEIGAVARRAWCLGAVALFLVITAAPALAHGEPTGETPAADSAVAKIPGEVSLELSEPPTRDSLLKVKDGCDRNVVSDLEIDGANMVAGITGAEPGKWVASYQVVSATDGHPTQGRWSFTVEGKKDCSQGSGGGRGQNEETTLDRDSENNNSSVEAESGANAASTDAVDDGGGFPVVPVALGAAGIVVLAVIVRATAGRR